MNDKLICTPRLPTELLEKIIFETWVSHLSADDRITFITSSFLVNKTWKALFTYFSFRDVYIPSHSYLHYYLRAISGYSLFFDKDHKGLPDQLCRSITITIRQAADVTQEPPMGKVLSDLLYSLTAVPYLPNLRSLNIEYENVGYGDLLAYDRLAWFPAQITDLNISFAFEAHKPTALQSSLTSHFRPIQHHGLTHLSFAGASDALGKSIVACFPNAEPPTILPPPKLITGSTRQPLKPSRLTEGRESLSIDSGKCAAEIWASTACWASLLNSALLGNARAL